jgi:hypothetical protein
VEALFALLDACMGCRVVVFDYVTWHCRIRRIRPSRVRLRTQQTNKQDRQFTYNVTMRRFRATIVAGEKQ